MRITFIRQNDDWNIECLHVFENEILPIAVSYFGSSLRTRVSLFSNKIIDEILVCFLFLKETIQ